MLEYLYQEGNVLISVIIPDVQEDPVIHISKGEISVLQWDRLCNKVNALLNERQK